jgi:hypothetical protein
MVPAFMMMKPTASDAMTAFAERVIAPTAHL